MPHITKISVIILIIIAFLLMSSGAVKASECSSGSTLSFVAHQDDDILFLSPDILHDIQSGKCVTTVFVTAGDDNKGNIYWLSREEGAKAAYAQMAGTSSSWSVFDAGVSGHPMPRFQLNGNPNVSLIFMRLPDGNIDGNGFPANNYQSIQKLWQDKISNIIPVDGTADYSKQDLKATFINLLNAYNPDRIRTQDYVGNLGDGDHSDHHITAYIVDQAKNSYLSEYTFTGYVDYRTASLSANITGSDLTKKQNAFFAYAVYDSNVCQTLSSCSTQDYGKWLERQYIAGSTVSQGSTPPTTDPKNLALSATVNASSQNISTNQGSVKAIDGVADGFPGDYTKEWATLGEKAGAWINLSWPTTQTINKVVLFDRPNTMDQVTGGSLVFSDGTTVGVGSLNNNGVATSIEFPTKNTSSLRLNITNTSGSTINIGLSEIQVYSVGAVNTPSPTVTPTATPIPSATASPTPVVSPTAIPNGTGFTGQYFNNQSLSGSPVLTRSDTNINFNWGMDSPAVTVNADHFSVRWIGYRNFSAANYKFTVSADDGVRLYIDDKLIINKWLDQGTTSYTSNQNLTGGGHKITYEYYDNTEDAVATFNYSLQSSATAAPTPTPLTTPGPTLAPTPSTTPSPTLPSQISINGLNGQYFNTIDLSGNSILNRIDTNINFSWGMGSPDLSIISDRFSIRWTGFINPAFSENYTFCVKSDDGAKVWINNQQVVDSWKDQAETEKCGNITLFSGNKVPIKVEFYDNTEDASIFLYWQSASRTKQIVPNSKLTIN